MIGSLEYFQEKGFIGKACRVLFGIPFFHAHRVWKELRLVNFSYGENILDLGCGDGLFGNQLADLYQSYVYGVDRLARRVAMANQTSAFYRLRCEYSVADIEALNFLKDTKKQFDTVLLLDVLEHLERPKDVIGYVIGTVKKEGKIIVRVPTETQGRYIFRDFPERFGYGCDHHLRDGFSLAELDSLFVGGFGLARVATIGMYGPTMSIVWEFSECIRWFSEVLYAMLMPLFLVCIWVVGDRNDLLFDIDHRECNCNGLFVVYQKT